MSVVDSEDQVNSSLLPFYCLSSPPFLSKGKEKKNQFIEGSVSATLILRTLNLQTFYSGLLALQCAQY